MTCILRAQMEPGAGKWKTWLIHPAELRVCLQSFATTRPVPERRRLTPRSHAVRHKHPSSRSHWRRFPPKRLPGVRRVTHWRAQPARRSPSCRSLTHFRFRVLKCSTSLSLVPLVACDAAVSDKTHSSVGQSRANEVSSFGNVRSGADFLNPDKRINSCKSISHPPKGLCSSSSLNVGVELLRPRFF
jgi:hypothetical protein